MLFTGLKLDTILHVALGEVDIGAVDWTSDGHWTVEDTEAGGTGLHRRINSCVVLQTSYLV